MDYNFESLHYTQGDRDMFIVIGSIPGAAQLVAVPAKGGWNPAKPASNSNRIQDAAHRAGIRDYLIEETRPIMGAITLYAHPDDAVWNAVDGFNNVAYLRVKMGAKVEVNDGQHRLGGGSDVLSMEDALDEVTRRRVADMGVPFIIVLERDAWKKAQDYGDLQTNVKPPTKSLGASMNRRVPFNRFVMDLSLDTAVTLFSDVEPGERIDFQKDSPGKLSAKWASYKTLHYMVALLLAGSDIRSTNALLKKLNGLVQSGDAGHATLVAFYNALTQNSPVLSSLVNGKVKMADVRKDTLLTSAGVLYGIAHAAHKLVAKTTMTLAEAGAALGALDYSRPNGNGLFLGNLVNADTGKISAGRDAWMAAGDALAEAVSPGVTKAAPAKAAAPVKKVTRRATKAA